MKTAPKSELERGYDPERLVQTHQAGVWRYLRSLGCSTAQADDLTQETFLAVLKRPFQEINETATAAYLRRTAYHAFVSMQRRSGRVQSVENIEEFDQAWEEWMARDDAEELLGHLRTCLQQLTNRARQALEMRFAKKATRSEIANSLAMSEHGAKNLMQRAKHKLRDCIERKLGVER